MKSLLLLFAHLRQGFERPSSAVIEPAEVLCPQPSSIVIRDRAWLRVRARRGGITADDLVSWLVDWVS